MKDDLCRAQLQILEDAAVAEPEGRDFLKLVRALGFSERTRTMVSVGLCLARWRSANRPFECLRRWVLMQGESRRPARRHEDIWTKATRTAVEPDELYDDVFDDAPSLAERVRPEFQVFDRETRETTVRWTEVQRALGLSRIERKALQLQLEGVELDDALSRERRLANRDALAQAWGSLAGRKSELRRVLFGEN